MSLGERRQQRSRSSEDSPRGGGLAPKSLLSRAVALLARRDHSRAELARKLARRNDDDDDSGEVDQLLDELERHGLISDERFAAATVRTRARRFGNARIQYDLRRLGVADEATAAALRTFAGSEVSRVRDVWQRRFGAMPASAAERSKQARFLQSRGFSLSAIRAVLRGNADEES